MESSTEMCYISLERVDYKLPNDIKYDFTASNIATLVDFFQCEPFI